ncbi:MAG: MIP family channel protein [Planctomycetes bacterium]|nr:MIP family channel protein [Planctomycetota bacterium]
MLKGTAREAAAEFFGTFVLIVFGVGVNAQVTLAGGTAGEWLSINIGWGLAVMLGIYACAGVSGAHINPAVTLTLAVCRGFPWRKVVPYMLAQVAGAFAASALVFLVYHEALDAFDGGVRQIAGPEGTAGIWATYPKQFRPESVLSTFPGGLIDQVVGTALLLALVFAVADRRNSAPEPGMAPIAVGLIVAAIGMAFGYNAGYAINPARDLGPRLFTFVGGWGAEVFTVNDYWSWVPIIGPFVGGLVGGVAYDALVARHHPPIDG